MLAFSPAAGGPLAGCLARVWIESISVPVSVFRPRSEMQLVSSVEQGQIMSSAGAKFQVIEDGVHGSSMLVDSRTGHDMEETRRTVLEWLTALSNR